MDVTRLYKFVWFGDIHGPNTYKMHRVSMGIYFTDTGKAEFMLERAKAHHELLKTEVRNCESSPNNKILACTITLEVV